MGGDSEKIICLKVTDEQVKKLKEAESNNIGCTYFLNMDDNKDFYSKLKEFGRRVQSVYGEIGKEIHEI